ncbi:MAG: ribose 5-phosphate isomerase B [Actinomycetota bacterium]
MERIAVGSDHAGFELKVHLTLFLQRKGLEVIDVGTANGESVDYPDFARAVARMVSGGEVPRGLLICGTGAGMAMAANKVPGIRAAAVSDLYTARLSREHNDSNVLCLGARILATPLAEAIVDTWLTTPFGGGRHQIRVDKIAALETGAGPAGSADRRMREENC